MATATIDGNRTPENNNEDLYYQMLESRWGSIDHNDVNQIKAYNEWARNLRHAMLD